MGFDWDDVLAYTTSRRVRIRHKWVGGICKRTPASHRHRSSATRSRPGPIVLPSTCTDYFTMVAILAYTIGYQVFILQGYLLLEPIVGSIRATVEPAKTSTPISNLTYCEKSGAVVASGVQLSCVSFEVRATRIATPICSARAW